MKLLIAMIGLFIGAAIAGGWGGLVGFVLGWWAWYFWQGLTDAVSERNSQPMPYDDSYDDLTHF